MKLIRCAKGHPYAPTLPECPTCAGELSLIQGDDPVPARGPGADGSAEFRSDSVVEQRSAADREDTEPPERAASFGTRRAPPPEPREVAPGRESRAGNWFSKKPAAQPRQPDAAAPDDAADASRKDLDDATPARRAAPHNAAGAAGAASPAAPAAAQARPLRAPEIGESDPVDHLERVRVHAVDRRQLLAIGFLVMLDGAEPGRFFALFEGVNNLGKASNPDNAVQVPIDKFVSRSHAEIEFKAEDGGVYLLRDLGSSNGTYLNDAPRRLAPNEDIALLPGDVVRLGRTRFRFVPLYP